MRQQSVRRDRWGATGGLVGGCVSLLYLAVILALGVTSLAAFVVVFLIWLSGQWLGVVLSGRCTRLSAGGRTRLASLQVHGLRDYLSATQRKLQLVAIVAGCSLVVAALLLALMSGRGLGDPVVDYVLAVGLLLAVSTMLALVTEVALLREPRAAETEGGLVADGVALAVALKDALLLLSGSWMSAMVLALSGPIEAEGPWPVIGLATGGLLFLASLILTESRLRPDLVPVAQRIVTRRQPV